MTRRLVPLLMALLLPTAAHAGKAFDPDATSSQALLDYLDHGDWEFRLDAVRAVRTRCLAEAEGRLATMVESDPAGKVRHAAVVTLADCGMDSAVNAAEMASLMDAEPSTRRKAIAVLERIGTERSGPILAQVVRGDPDLGTRRKAATVLRKRAWRGAEPVQEIVAFDGEDPDLRLECVRGLIALDAVRYRRVLHDALASEPDDGAHLALTRAVEAAPLPADRDVLLGLLDDRNPHVQRHAARALGTLGDRTVAPILRQKSENAADPRVAEEFAEIATSLGG
jgi:HEAT repeat protein